MNDYLALVRPRFAARFWAWLNGYFWLPCDVCGESFAGFEHVWGVPAMCDDGRTYGVCPKPSCQKCTQEAWPDFPMGKPLKTFIHKANL